MARAGRFGRLPRSSPSLTSTIVSLLREYAAQVDSNMVDAWKSGGLVDGKPVDDARLLAHFTMRRDELSKTDPKWAEWDNRVTQYTFSIDESKMQVRWANGTATRQEMGAFYQSWEQKTPDNTEFDRTLRQQYGQWMQLANNRAAASSNSSGSGSGSGSRYAKKVNDVINSQITPGKWANDLVTQLAVEAGIIPTGSTMDLTDTEVSQGDVAALTDLLSDGKSADPRLQALLNNIADQMKAVDPNFHWGIDYFTTTIDKAKSGYDTIINDPTTTNANKKAWAKEQASLSITGNRLAALPALQDYIDAGKELDTALAASNNDPGKVRSAYAQYSQRLHSVIGRVGTTDINVASDVVIGPLEAEVRMIDAGLSGQALTAEAPITATDTSTQSSSQAVGNAGGVHQQNLNLMNANAQTIRSGGWASVGQGGMLQFFPPTVAKPVGSVVAHMMVDGVPDAPVYSPTENVNVIPVDVHGVPLNLAPGVLDPATGMLVPAADVGFRTATFPDPNGGKASTLYISVGPDGNSIITLTPPLDPSSLATQGTGPKGEPLITVTVGGTSSLQPAKVVNPQTGAETNGFDISAASVVSKTFPKYLIGAGSELPYGMFRSTDAALLQSQIDRLDPKSSTYAYDHQQLLDQVAALPDTLAQRAATQAATGDYQSAAQTRASIAGVQSDAAAVLGALDYRVIGLRKDADASATASPLTVDQQAKLWLLNQVSAYDSTKGFGSPDFGKAPPPPPSLATGRGGAYGQQGSAGQLPPQQLRDQITSAADARTLKLPDYVFGSGQATTYSEHIGTPKSFAAQPLVYTGNYPGQAAPTPPPPNSPSTINPPTFVIPPPPNSTGAKALFGDTGTVPNELPIAQPRPPTPLVKPGMAPRPS